MSESKIKEMGDDTIKEMAESITIKIKEEPLDSNEVTEQNCDVMINVIVEDVEEEQPSTSNPTNVLEIGQKTRESLIAAAPKFYYCSFCKVCHLSSETRCSGPNKAKPKTPMVKVKNKVKIVTHPKKYIHSKKYICDICAEKFPSMFNLNRHRKTHLVGGGKFQCKECGENFVGKKTLEIHARCHSDESDDKPFMCEICGNKFGNDANLKKHIRCVHEEKPFKCEKCNRTFVTELQLENHVICKVREESDVIERRRIYKCELCEKSFTQNTYLKIHYRTIHEGERPFECEICNQTFAQKGNLKRHKFLCHKSECEQGS